MSVDVVAAVLTWQFIRSCGVGRVSPHVIIPIVTVPSRGVTRQPGAVAAAPA